MAVTICFGFQNRHTIKFLVFFKFSLNLLQVLKLFLTLKNFIKLKWYLKLKALILFFYNNLLVRQWKFVLCFQPLSQVEKSPICILSYRNFDDFEDL